MKKVFPLTVGGYEYMGVANSITNDSEWRKIELRYYEILDGGVIREITSGTIETYKIEKLCRKWCNKNELCLWTY